IVQGKVTDAGTGTRKTARVSVSHGVAELMLDSVDRPLLREGIDPVVGLDAAQEGADVLNHGWFLVVSLLHEEAVVLDGVGFGLDFRRDILRGEGPDASDEGDDQEDTATKHECRPSCYEIENHFQLHLSLNSGPGSCL